MKELSIEEKANAYDNIIKKANKMHSENCEACQMCIEELIPELKESEDEKIRKRIISALVEWEDKCSFPGDSGDMIAWLEKQGEQKPTQEIEPTPIFKIGDILKRKGKDYTFRVDRIQGGYYHCDRNHGAFFPIEEQGNWELVEQKPADKVEPKFKIGDWIIYNRNDHSREVIQIYDIRDNRYYFNDNIHFSWSVKECDEKSHLWTIEDAKDGDVLVNQNGEMPFIFKECENNHIYCYCGYTNIKDIFFARFVDSEGEELHWLNLYHEQAYPATKEQRDLLFKKIHETGYEWDAEELELKKIEQSLAWSEKDEMMWSSVLQDLQNIKDNNPIVNIAPEFNWLKSLKERYTWKPSDEQLKALNAINVTGCISYAGQGQELVNLFNDLKKLKE